MLKGFQINLVPGIILIWTMAYVPATIASDSDVLLLFSSDNSYYQRTASALRQHYGGNQQFTILTLDDNNEPEPALPATTNRIITFGSKAASFVIQRGLADRSIASYLTYEQFLQLEDNRIPAVALLDQPLSRYLAFSRLLVRNARIGTLVSSNEKLPDLDTIDSRGDLLVSGPVSDRRLISDLRSMLQDIDIFLMTPNRGLFNRNSLRGILLATYRANKPVISFSPSHVTSGALGSVFSSPDDIGRHLAELLGETSEDNRGGAGKVEFARYFSIAINRKVGRSLGIFLPDDETIMARLQGGAR